jgi:DNA-binding NarL/FixJ family response regulator
MPPISVLIVDDHPLFSRGLASLIAGQGQYAVCGEAVSSAEALALMESKKPDLAIVDLRLGDEDGLEVIKKLKARDAGLRVLALSMQDERYFSERALNAGSNGYIMKTEAGAKVLEAIKTVLAGGTYISEAERERLLEFTAGEIPRGAGDPFALVEKLSNRQLRVFTLIGKGLGTLEIASLLNISTKTVDAHKENLKLRLHCRTAQELRQLAIEWAKK